MIVAGIDPGTKTSATGVSIYKDGVLLEVRGFGPPPPKLDLIERISWLMSSIIAYIIHWRVEKACIEESVYRGKANHALQRFLGILEYMLRCNGTKIQTVNPSTLKLYYGKGNLDKEEIARRMIADKLFTPAERDILQTVINNEEWDLTDAIAIGYYGVKNAETRIVKKPKRKSKRKLKTADRS